MEQVKKLWLLILTALCALPPLAGAGEPRVTVTARPREFRAGGETRVSITIEGDKQPDDLKLPELADAVWRTDRVSRASRVNIVNGRRSESLIFTLPLSCSKPGELVIPALAVRFADGKTARSAPVKLTVLAPGEPAKYAAPEPSGRIVVKEKRRNFYVGESIPVELELAIPEGMRIADLGFPHLRCDGPMVMPDLAGINPRHPHYLAPVEGERASSGGVVTTVAFPTRPRFMRPGDFTLTGTQTLTVAMPRRSEPDELFDDPFLSGGFFRQETRRIELAYPPEKLQVLPLPPAPAGARQLGTCAKCRIAAAVSAASARVGEPVELEVSVSGETEFADLTPPPLELSGFRVYPPADSRSADGVRKFRYALIPLAPGEHGIRFDFAVFDPAAGGWKTAAVDETLAVTGAAAAPPPPPQAPDPRPAPEVGKLPPLPKQRPERGTEVTTMPLKIGLLKGGFAFAALALAALAVEVARGLRKKRDPDRAERRKLVAELIRRAKNGDDPDAILRDGGAAVLARACGLAEDASPNEIAEKIDDAELRQVLDELEYNSFAPEAERHRRPISAAARRRFVKLLKRALILAVLVLAFDSRAAEPEPLPRRLDPDSLFNTGMAFRRDGDLPRARLALERAHRLAPRDREILSALETTENELGAPPSARSLRDLFRPDEYLSAAGVLFGLALLGFALLRGKLRRTAFAAAWLFAALGAVAAALAWSQYGENGPYRTDRAIVVGGKAELSSLPLESGGRVVGTLDGGSEVVIVEEKGGFVRVRAGDLDGWCRRRDAERILPVQFP